MERKGIITMKGAPMTLEGNPIKTGDHAPDFTVLDQDSNPVSLKDFKGKLKVISVTPSIDTPVCDLQATWFNEDASALSEDIIILNISMDLPFALKRYCAAKGIDRAKTLSDHRQASFGNAYGLLIKELRLLARAVLVIDKNDVVRYFQLVPEATNSPDYDDITKAIQALL